MIIMMMIIILSLYLQNIRQQYQWISGISFLLGLQVPKNQEGHQQLCKEGRQETTPN